MSEPFGAPRRLSTSSVLLWHPDILPAIKVPKEATGWGFKPASDSPGPSDWVPGFFSCEKKPYGHNEIEKRGKKEKGIGEEEMILNNGDDAVIALHIIVVIA